MIKLKSIETPITPNQAYSLLDMFSKVNNPQLQKSVLSCNYGNLRSIARKIDKFFTKLQKQYILKKFKFPVNPNPQFKINQQGFIEYKTEILNEEGDNTFTNYEEKELKFLEWKEIASNPIYADMVLQFQNWLLQNDKAVLAVYQKEIEKTHTINYYRVVENDLNEQEKASLFANSENPEDLYNCVVFVDSEKEADEELEGLSLEEPKLDEEMEKSNS
jgi:hypothetical protein